MKGVSSMNFAKKFLPAVFVLSAEAALAAAVEVSSVRQNWPWDTRVVIDYTITGDEEVDVLTASVVEELIVDGADGALCV